MIDFYFANCVYKDVLSYSTAGIWLKDIITKIESIFELVCLSEKVTRYAIEYTILLSNKIEENDAKSVNYDKIESELTRLHCEKKLLTLWVTSDNFSKLTSCNLNLFKKMFEKL